MSLVAGKIGLRLVELRLIGARIELGQELALLDRLPVLKSMLTICSVTMLRMVAVFSAATLPIPVSTMGNSRC
jgi:hypothetical protein